MISRPRLLSILDDAARQRLTTVVAPAGYGKTVLLSQWVKFLDDDAVAWITLRPVHNRRSRLTGDLQRAIRLLEGAGSATLVLDDFGVVTDPQALDDCAALIEEAPETLRVVLASRSEPPPRYSRLRLSDALAEVRASDLALTSDEVAELSPPSPLDEVMARTRGWAYGLELLGDDRRVDDYLTTEVLNPASEDARAFLLSTSVLDRMSGPLCDFVTGGRRSQAMLEDLESSGSFVASLDPHREWFTYHPMLRAVLRRHLGDDGGRADQLLHRAAEWHLARGEVEPGVSYLIEAGADDEVVEAAFTHGSTMFEQHRLAEVAEWIGHASPSPEQSQASVALLEAASLTFANARPGLRELLDRVDAMPGALPAERLVGDLLRSYFELGEGAQTAAIEASDRVLAGVDSVDDADLPNLFGLTCTRSDVAAGARVARAVALMYEGQLVAARCDLERVGEEVHGIWRASALGALSLLEAWSGNLTRGEDLATQALSLADSLGHDPPSRTTAWLALALVARERNDLDRAAALLDDVDSAGGSRRRAVAVWVAAERAFMALATDTAPAGLATLAGQLVSAHPSLPTGVLARRWAAEALLRIASGDLDAATDLVELDFEGGSSEMMGARARLAVERGDTTRARALVDAWPDEPQPRIRRERRLWTAILDHLDGSEAAAASAMAAVVAEAEAEGDVGLFQAAGKYAMGPARALYRAAPTVFLRELVDQPFIAGRAAPAKGLAEQLTDREYMVLVHLPSRQSNAEIANRLGVSLNTVKTHLKHIYRKLDVVGRSEAVEAAEKFHLL